MRASSALTIATLAVAVLGAAPGAAGAATTQTLKGHQWANGIADDPEPASLALETSFSAGAASGSVSTTTATGTMTWASFDGSVTCVRQSGARLVVGGFGHAFHEEVVYSEARHEQVRVAHELPGTYAQIVVFQFGEFEDIWGNHTFHAHAWNTIGSEGEGQPSAAAPSCAGWSTVKVRWVGEEGEIGLSPTIASPHQGAILKVTETTLKGRGEPNGKLKVFEPAHPGGAVTVTVSKTGTWSLARKGLTAGAHEFVAQPLQETGVTTAAHVSFTVQ